YVSAGVFLTPAESGSHFGCTPGCTLVAPNRGWSETTGDGKGYGSLPDACSVNPYWSGLLDCWGQLGTPGRKWAHLDSNQEPWDYESAWAHFYYCPSVPSYAYPARTMANCPSTGVYRFPGLSSLLATVRLQCGQGALTLGH